MTNRSAWGRLGAAALLGAVAVLIAVPVAAYAHVEVDSGSVPAKGGDGVVRLTVPTESDTASTVGLTVTIPQDVALAEARVLPIAGWSATVETAGERVTRIVWRAEDTKKGGIGPSQFGIFTFSASPWPKDRDTVPLPTTQQYSDGSAVVWDEVALDADSEPKHPAPLVTLGEAFAGHNTHVANVSSDNGGAGGAEIAQWVLIGLAVLLSATAAARASVAAARGR